MSLFHYKHRPPHMGKYPMETVKRVDQPTTRIDAETRACTLPVILRSEATKDLPAFSALEYCWLPIYTGRFRSCRPSRPLSEPDVSENSRLRGNDGAQKCRRRPPRVARPGTGLGCWSA